MSNNSSSPEFRPFLHVKNVTIKFGGIIALNNVSFELQEGKILGLIGPNGAGKTTLFNCLSCLYKVSQGDILYKGISLIKKKPYQIAQLGINRTFQTIALFNTMNVLDNILIGGHSRTKSDFFSNAFRLPWVDREEAQLKKEALEIANFLQLDSLLLRKVASLPIVLQKRVELARALISKPKLLLLDEPASGLAHEEVQELKALIIKVRNEWLTTILIVEHHMNLIMQVSDRIVVLDFGCKIAEGTPNEVQQNPEVITAYLGKG